METSWRWHAARQVMARLHEPAHTEPESAWNAYGEQLNHCVDMILSAARAIDHTNSATTGPESVWIEIITNNSA